MRRGTRAATDSHGADISSSRQLICGPCLRAAGRRRRSQAPGLWASQNSASRPLATRRRCAERGPQACSICAQQPQRRSRGCCVFCPSQSRSLGLGSSRARRGDAAKNKRAGPQDNPGGATPTNLLLVPRVTLVSSSSSSVYCDCVGPRASSLSSSASPHPPRGPVQPGPSAARDPLRRFAAVGHQLAELGLRGGADPVSTTCSSLDANPGRP